MTIFIDYETGFMHVDLDKFLPARQKDWRMVCNLICEYWSSYGVHRVLQYIEKRYLKETSKVKKNALAKNCDLLFDMWYTHYEDE